MYGIMNNIRQTELQSPQAYSPNCLTQIVKVDEKWITFKNVIHKRQGYHTDERPKVFSKSGFHGRTFQGGIDEE